MAVYTKKSSPVLVLSKGLLNQTTDPDMPEVKMFVASLAQAALMAAQGLKAQRKKDAASLDQIDALEFIKNPSRHSNMCQIIGLEPSFYSKSALRTIDAILGTPLEEGRVN